jgi:hypothetical protein
MNVQSLLGTIFLILPIQEGQGTDLISSTSIDLFMLATLIPAADTIRINQLEVFVTRWRHGPKYIL